MTRTGPKLQSNMNQPRPPRGIPPVPDWLPINDSDEHDKVRADWDRYSTWLNKAGIITVADGAILGAFCIQLWQIRGCLSAMRRYPNAATSERRRISSTLNSASALMLRLSACLGLDPASRRSLIIADDPHDERSEMEKFQSEGDDRRAKLKITGSRGDESA